MSQDIVERLRAGQSLADFWSNRTENLLSEAASLITTLTAERDALAKALDRQCDNMAFVVNHVSLHAWYDKFKNELEQDRATLSLGAKQ